MSEEPTPPNPVEADGFERAFTLSKIMDEMRSVAAYEMPDQVKDQFLALWQHSCIEHPEITERLKTAEHGRRDWRIIVTDAILTDVQEGVAALHYHLDEIRWIETEIVAKLTTAARAAHIDEPLFGGGGNSRRLDFAYQAHILAVRRTLEYFAGSVAAFFKSENPGFRKLSEKLERARPAELRDATLSTLEKHKNVHDRILTNGNNRSVRDRIAHWKTVPAGVVNVQLHPSGEARVFLAGGGEDLSAPEPTELTSLSAVLTHAAEEVVQMIFDTYRAMGLMPDTTPPRL